MKEIVLDILTDGSIRFIRCNEEINESTLKIVSELAPTKKDEIMRFLNGSKQIEIIFGEESLCG